MSDNAFFERLQVILGRQHAHVLSPAMEAVLARHRPSTTTTGPPQHSVPSADELSAQPATVPAQRFGLMRKRKDPVDDILQRQPQSATKSTSPLNTAHWSFRRLSEMLDVSWDALRQEFGIVLEVHSFRSAGGLFGLHAKSIRPVRCWDELCDARCEVLVRYLNHRYAFPSPIQAQSLPIAMLRPAQHNDRKDATDTVGAATIGKVDLLGVAETGSGKTMCYLIPALEHIVMDEVPLTAARAELGPLAMVLVPTRELAEQVYAEALRIKEFAASHRTAAPNVSCCAAIEDLKIAKVVGGESATVQHDIISKGVHLLIGTPGQLASLLEERYLSLGNTKFVAIDEADRMVEEMMTDQLCSVLHHCPVPRQTIMFTATMLPECRTIATKFLSPRGYFVVKTPYTFQSVWQTFELFPTTASVGEDDDRAKTAAALFEAKFQRLAQWLAFHKGPMIVFSNEKTTCDLIGKRLRELAQRSQRGLDEIVWGSGETATADARGLGGQDTVRGGTCPWLMSKKTVAPMYNQLSRVIVVHAGLTQAERRAAVQQLQNGDASILVTTDLLARGLDVRGLDLVINFDLPESHHSSGSDSDGELTLMKYIHRIGRTGRAGNKGQAVSFVSLPLDTVKRGSKAAIMLAAIETADGPPPPPRKGVRRDDDDADEAMMPTTKRARDDVDEPPLKSRASVGDQPILAPLFRFLRDCATHSSLCTTEQDFVSRCRSHVLPRFSIPEPLLLTMHSLSKDMVNGAILW